MSLGSGAWYGASGDCGCCGERPPLGGCCGEGYDDCIPEGFRNFSSMRAVVEIDDEFTFYERFHVGVCSGPCVGQDRVQTWDYTLSGLAAVNGTYDAKYIFRDPDTFEWEEIETDRLNRCGSWWFPWVEVEVVNTERYTSVFSGGCFSSIDTTTTGPTTVWFSPYLGRFFPSKTDSSHPFLSLFFGTKTGTHPLLLCDPSQMDSEFIGYTCRPKTTVNASQYGHVETSARPVSCSALPSIASGFNLQTFFNNTVQDGATLVGGPVGIGGALRNATVDGVDGLVVPFGLSTGAFAGQGENCVLYYQSVEKTIQDYNFSDSRNASCHPTVPDPLVNEIEWSAFNRKHSILINV
jgi:hypothetical protein